MKYLNYDDISNNENIITLSIYTEKNCHDWLKCDGFGHDVTNIELATPHL